VQSNESVNTSWHNFAMHTSRSGKTTSNIPYSKFYRSSNSSSSSDSDDDETSVTENIEGTPIVDLASPEGNQKLPPLIKNKVNLVIDAVGDIKKVTYQTLRDRDSDFDGFDTATKRKISNYLYYRRAKDPIHPTVLFSDEIVLPTISHQNVNMATTNSGYKKFLPRGYDPRRIGE
jgi:hypothetical protein